MSHYGRRIRSDSARSRINAKRLLIYYACLLVFLLLISVIQVSRFKVFNSTPALAFCTVCAVGFIFGERSGAIFGLLGGYLVSALSISGFSFDIILFTVCGYLCGKCVGWFLSINLPSFALYAAVFGLLKEIFTFIHLGFISTEFDLLYILKDIILREYFAFALFIVPIYYAILGIYYLFRGRDKKEFRY